MYVKYIPIFIMNTRNFEFWIFADILLGTIKYIKIVFIFLITVSGNKNEIVQF